MRFDLLSPPSMLDAFVKTRASLDPAGPDSVIAFRGRVYGVVPESGTRHLLDIEGFSVARAVPTGSGYDLLSREVAVFRHPGGGAIANSFVNPYCGDRQPVHHVWNDPVNRAIRAKDVTVDRMGDSVHFSTDDFTSEANPLPPAKWPTESTGELLERMDVTRFVASGAGLDADGPTAACQLSSVRHEPWLPWMHMGKHPGHLMTHLGGAKLPRGYGALPDSIREHVETNRPEFAFAPRSFATPNETSWTLYAKEFQPSVHRQSAR